MELRTLPTPELVEMLDRLNVLQNPTHRDYTLMDEISLVLDVRRELVDVPLVVTDELWNSLQSHGVRNYERGWDVFVECWSREDVQEVVTRIGSNNFHKVVDDIRKTMNLIKEVGDDIRGS